MSGLHPGGGLNAPKGIDWVRTNLVKRFSASITVLMPRRALIGFGQSRQTRMGRGSYIGLNAPKGIDWVRTANELNEHTSQAIRLNAPKGIDWVRTNHMRIRAQLYRVVLMPRRALIGFGRTVSSVVSSICGWVLMPRRALIGFGRKCMTCYLAT